MTQNTTSEKSLHRRKFFSFLSNKSQIKYALVSLYFTISGIVVFAILCYMRVSQDIKAELPISEDLQLWSSNFFNFLFMTAIFLTLLMGSVIVLYTLLFTHRFTGPMVQLHHILDEMLAGDFSHRVKFREDDENMGLEVKFNLLLEKLEKTHFIPR